MALITVTQPLWIERYLVSDILQLSFMLHGFEPHAVVHVPTLTRDTGSTGTQVSFTVSSSSKSLQI